MEKSFILCIQIIDLEETGHPNPIVPMGYMLLNEGPDMSRSSISFTRRHNINISV